MRKHRVWHILGVLAVISILMVSALPTAVIAKPIDYSPVDVGPRIREWPATAEMVKKDAPPDATTMAVVDATLIDTKYFLILNDYTGQYGVTSFNLYDVGDGTSAQIWVQNNLAFPAGDPRVEPVITGEQMAYILAEFEENILPTESAFFGTPAMLDGSYAVLPGMLGLASDYYYDSAGKTIILVSNIRDDNYYDPDYPVYIAGFYSPSFEIYFDRNIISIDAYDWANRTGPDGTRPYLYEGVVAHEWQHLLHDDYDSDEETFINEGMSEYAEILCGYTQSLQGHIDAAAENPENSLTVWEDQGDLEILTDYGQAALFQIYLNEQFGKKYTQALFHNPENGISGVNSAFAQLKIKTDFQTVFDDWTIAMLLNSLKAGGKYAIKTFPDFRLDVGTPDAPNPEAYDTPGAPPWGTDFIWITGDPKGLAKFAFNGVEYGMIPSAWTSDGNVLWSGTGDLIDNWAIFDATGGGLLTFDTYWDIEDYWDFGFVQVSTDNGLTWTSLANDYTTSVYDPNAHPKVIENLPGLTSWSEFLDPDGWINVSYDLSAYAGQDILVAFRYITDWGTTYDGWFIDNVYVGGTPLSDGTSMDPFKDISWYFPVQQDFTVTFVAMKGVGKSLQYKIVSMELDNITEEGLFELDQVIDWSDKTVVLISYNALDGATMYADYTFELIYANRGPKK